MTVADKLRFAAKHTLNGDGPVRDYIHATDLEAAADLIDALLRATAWVPEYLRRTDRGQHSVSIPMADLRQINAALMMVRDARP